MSTKSQNKSRRKRKVLVKSLGEMVMRYADARAPYTPDPCHDGVCSLDPDFAARRRKLMAVGKTQDVPTAERRVET